MLKTITALTMVTMLCVSVSHAADGLVRVKSAHDVATTAERLSTILTERGMNIIARVQHSEAAKNAQLELRPTELLIFGNPKVGTPLMQCGQAVGIDLPQKALIWEDEAGGVWLAYNDTEYLKGRHSLEGCDAVLGKVSTALAGFAEAATAP